MYLIASLPDTVTATAVSLTVNASGVVTLQTFELLTPEQVDEASKKSVDYRRQERKSDIHGLGPDRRRSGIGPWC